MKLLDLFRSTGRRPSRAARPHTTRPLLEQLETREVLSPFLYSATQGAPISNMEVTDFGDNYVGVKATDFKATVNWGDGSQSAGVVKQDPLGGPHGFDVFASKASPYTETGYMANATVMVTGPFSSAGEIFTMQYAQGIVVYPAATGSDFFNSNSQAQPDAGQQPSGDTGSQLQPVTANAGQPAATAPVFNLGTQVNSTRTSVGHGETAPTGGTSGTTATPPAATSAPKQNPAPQTVPGTETINGIEVTTNKDGNDKTQSGDGNTSYTPGKAKSPGYLYGGDGKISEIKGSTAPLKVTIGTTYRPGVDPNSTSAYGRGTTTGDKAKGDTSLGFHESQHREAYKSYLQSHKPPEFTGKLGQTEAEFKTAQSDYIKAVQNYFDDAAKYANESVDETGNKMSEFQSGGKR